MNKPVLTGQQVGLLGGPLYTTYKVLGAVHYSNTIKGTPVYWVETNDADFNEINHIHFLDKENRLTTLKWDIDSKGYSCGFIKVDEKLLALFETFFMSIKQTPHTDILRTIVLDCFKKGKSLGLAFCEFAEKLFGWSGIRIFNPSQHSFLSSIRPILEREAAITQPGSQCNFFCIDNKKRMAVFKKSDGFYFRDGRKIDLTKVTLVPNVKTRNVCQDAYFATDTYIAGPGEIQYIAELDPVYTRHNVRKAKVKKRMSVDLIEPRTHRLLQQCGLSIQDVTSFPKDVLVKKIVERETGSDYGKLRRSALEETDTYIHRLGSLGIETLRLNELLRNEIKRLTGKKRSQEKAALEKLLKKAKELSDRLFPFGNKQERTFTVMYYMNLYGGFDFIRWLYDHYNFDSKIVEIQND